VLRYLRLPTLHVIDSQSFAEMPEPGDTRRDMVNFVFGNAAQNPSRAIVAGSLETGYQ